MDFEIQDNDVYGLVCRLCENLFHKHYHVEEHPYFIPQQDNEKRLRRLKSKAFEILLNKSNQIYDNKPSDPILELLKHAYVLKVGVGCVSQAEELETFLSEFIDNGLETDSIIYLVLKFLNSLKSIDSNDNWSMDIFHYGNPHPMLPEMFCEKSNVPPFQIYPSESFCLPKKFESILKQESVNVITYHDVEPGSQMTVLEKFLSSNNFSSLSHNYNIGLISLKQCQLSSSRYFLPRLNDISGDTKYNQLCKGGIINQLQHLLQNKNHSQRFFKTNINYIDNQTEIHRIKKNSIFYEDRIDEIWENINKFSFISNHRTWETLGMFEPTKEPPFVSESIESTLHLINVSQNTILLNQHIVLHPDDIVSTKIFVSNIKLLLLGVESNTFIYNSLNGFELKNNVALPGISATTLENLSYKVTRWGTCFRNLSNLIIPDPQTGKLQIDGLIFKALCGSIKEFLLFYHAAILRVSIADDDNTELLRFIKKVRPLGKLITKVAELCRCDSQKSTLLGEGIGILTHIYNEVTKVTEQNIALVFYSILKDCCEIYFQLLQRWIFEGICVDIYDEFMIKIKPQYLRTRGHRFWTRAFSINKNSVPGFLSELSESILQCGKAVTLLKICDPQNPLCRVSASSQPLVRVCLSVAMLREQARFYENYTIRGKLEQDEEVSLNTAIQEQKEIEKRRAELVIAAQQDTLKRLKKEREDKLKQILKEKSNLLEQLKDQVEEVAQRKERDKDAELLADKLLMESILKYEEEVKNIEKVERENTIKYYNTLAEEAKKRRIHAEWRIHRMKLFDERVYALSSLQREFVNTPDETELHDSIVEKIEITKNSIDNKSRTCLNVKKLEDRKNIENNVEQKQINLNTEVSLEPLSFPNNMQIVDELLSENDNSKATFIKADKLLTENENKYIQATDQVNKNLIVESASTKATRPTVLDLVAVNSPNYYKGNINHLHAVDKSVFYPKLTQNLLNLEGIDSKAEAQRNKLKVLKSEYGITPNNNESATILFAIKDSKESSELTEIHINRMRNTQHLTDFNWDNTETKKGNIQDVDETNRNITELQLNRLKNTQSNWNEFSPDTRTTTEKHSLSEAQINRNKVMSHFYNRMEECETIVPKNEIITEFQRNRNRNVIHSMEQYNFEANKITDNEHFKETPMSTATDNFTVSTYSDLLQVLSSENTPFSEYTNQSDILFGRTSDCMSIDEAPQSQARKYFQESVTFPHFIGFGSLPSTPASQKQQLTVSDVEMIDTTSLQVYLEKSVVIPLTVQSRLVNNAIIKYLLKEHNMLSHLHSLRSYFFLLNGEFAKTLTQSLFVRLYEISTPIELFNSSSLTNFLEKALVSSLSNTYANSELLSLSAIEVPSYLQTSNPEILSCLTLNYKVSWPLNIIFNDIVMQQYSRVFKFLLMVGRVLWVLQEDFQILKIERKTAITAKHHKLQLYRHSMMQFMNALHTYLTCSVLHASWSEFEKELQHAMTLDEVYNTHVSYIKKILSRCMLTIRDEKMRSCLCNIFRIVLKFHNRIRSQNWSDGLQLVGSTYENLEKMYTAFCEQRAYLALVAEKLANSGYQPHLMQFLHALNINYRYDLSSKVLNT